MKKIRVVAAMSGGVDSSVTAFLLKEAGYDVVGMTMKLWKGANSTSESEKSCCGVSAINDARRVAQILDIPYYAMDMAQEFEDTVIKNFIDEYQAGRTPNPCIQCQIYAKFGVLMQKARQVGAEFVATGHYAKIVHGARHQIFKASADEKDQSYAFWPLPQDKLARILLPLGDLPNKDAVRAIASKLNLAVATKKESMDICFTDDHKEFLAGRGVKARPGEVVTEDGKIVGLHSGHQNFTVGQRKGLPAMGDPHYVLEIRAANNQVVIGKRDALNKTGFVVRDANWSGIPMPSTPVDAFVKVRYGATELPAVLTAAGNSVVVAAKTPVWAVSPGQSAVFYDSAGMVLGGGYIE